MLRSVSVSLQGVRWFFSLWKDVAIINWARYPTSSPQCSSLSETDHLIFEGSLPSMRPENGPATIARNGHTRS